MRRRSTAPLCATHAHLWQQMCIAAARLRGPLQGAARDRQRMCCRASSGGSSCFHCRIDPTTGRKSLHVDCDSGYMPQCQSWNYGAWPAFKSVRLPIVCPSDSLHYVECLNGLANVE